VRQLELRALRKLRQIGERIEDLRRNQGLELEDALALIDTDFSNRQCRAGSLLPDAL
jgi:hypothetical protein